MFSKNKIERKKWRVTVFAAVIFFASFNPPLVFADTVYLKNGTTFEGYFLSVKGRYLLFKTDTGKIRKIRSDTLERIAILYTGVNVCFSMKKTPTKLDCSGILHSIDLKTAVIISKDRKKKMNDIDIEDISTLSLKNSANYKIIPLLKEGFAVDVRTRRGNIRGKIVSTDRNRLVVKQKNGKIKTIKENSIQTVALDLDQMFPKARESALSVTQFIPAWTQFQQDRNWAGSLISGGFLILAGAGAHEYSAAVKMSNAAKSSLPYLLFKTPDYKRKFDKHQDNQSGIGALAFVLYMYHLFDAGVFSGARMDSEMKALLPAGSGRINFQTKRVDVFAGSELRQEVFFQVYF